MIKAVIFDFDGVLVQSEEVHRKTFMETYKPLGISTTKERWYREFIGTGAHHITEVLFTEHGVKENIDEWVKKRKERYLECIEKGEVTPANGLAEFLGFLKGRKIKTAIASGSRITSIEPILKQNGLMKAFDVIVSRDDVKERKPNPDSFLLAAKRLGVTPGECLVIEDSYAGFEAARNAGMRLVGMKGPVKLDFSACDYVINDFTGFPLGMFEAGL